MLRKNLIANYLGQGWTALMGLAFIPVYIHYLGIEAYGLIGLFGLLQAWLSLLDMGMTPTLSREMARFTGGSGDVQSIRNLLRSIEFVTFGISVLIAVGIFFASGWLATDWLRAEKLPVETVANAFTIMGIVTALRFVESIYRSCIVGLQRQVMLNAVYCGFSTLRGLGAVGILAWVSPTISAFFIWNGFISLMTVIAFALVTYGSLPKTRQPGHFSMDALRSVWRYAGGMIGLTFLGMLLTQSDKLILSKMLTLSDYGYYTLAAMVAGGLSVAGIPITQAWFPRLSQLHAIGDEKSLARTFHQGSQLVSVVVGSAAIVLILFSDTLLELWTRDKTISQNSAVLLSILATGNLLNILLWIPYQSQLAFGWTGLAIRVNLVSVAIIVPAIIWVTPRYGAEGAAFVWVALNAGYLIVWIHFMFRRILKSEKWRWYFHDLALPLSAATLAALLIKASMPQPETPLNQFLALALAFLLALTSSVVASGQVRTGVYSAVAQFSSRNRAENCS